MIDKTTRVLLAVIAACLVILTIRTFQVVPVQAGGETLLRVDVARIGGAPVTSFDGTRIIKGLSGR